MKCLAVWCPLRGTGEESAHRIVASVLVPLALAQFICSLAGSNMKHEGDDQRHPQGSGHTVQGFRRRSRSSCLSMAALMILAGKLTDRWGRKRCFTIGLIVYGIGALMSAVIGLTDEQPGDNIERENRREGAGGKHLCSTCAGLA